MATTGMVDGQEGRRPPRKEDVTEGLGRGGISGKGMKRSKEERREVRLGAKGGKPGEGGPATAGRVIADIRVKR